MVIASLFYWFLIRQEVAKYVCADRASDNIREISQDRGVTNKEGSEAMDFYYKDCLYSYGLTK